MTKTWGDTDVHFAVTGLKGCASVAIISKKGGWLSHFFESPSLLAANDADFRNQVTSLIQNGGDNFESPLQLAQPGGILAPDTNPQVYIMRPSNPSDPEVYNPHLDTALNLIIGGGAPFAGAPQQTHTYIKPYASQGDDVDRIMNSTPRGKVIVEFDPQDHNPPADPYDLNCDEGPPQKAARVTCEDQIYDPLIWDVGGTGNQKRQASSAKACTRSQSASGSQSGSSSGSSASSTVTGSSSGFVTSMTKSSSSNSASASPGSPITSGPSKTVSATQSSSNTAAPTPICYPFQDPDAGPGNSGCQCSGTTGLVPFMSNTASASDFNVCGYTVLPSSVPVSSVPPFTTTESDGEVLSCATSTYFNYAVNHDAECAGSSKVVSTVTSIASAYSASVASSASSASAASSASSWSAAAATPSAGCWILDDDGFGDSLFEVYGINGWAGQDGSKLFDQEDGCGILSGWEFHTDGESTFDGQLRSTQYAYFGLSFFKGGCVERAVASAGGPPKGDGPGQLACQHGPPDDSVSNEVKSNLASKQVDAVSSAASSDTSNSSLGGSKLGVEDKAVDNTNSSGTAGTDPSIQSSASAALPALKSMASSLGAPAPSAT